MSFSLRLLPLTLVVASLLLVVRVGGIWHGITSDGVGPSAALAAPALAEEAHTSAEPEASPAEPYVIGQPDLRDQLTLDEVEVLEKLAARRRTLDQRESELDLREGLLSAAEQRVDRKIQELEELRQRIEGLVRQYDEQEEAELRSLVKIYESMKPKDAARILEQLELGVMLAIMERMKERSSAPVLAAMDSERARVVTAELAGRLNFELPDG
ncbi:MAG: MotE family protein [Alphaproteobacteria bacterium]